MPNVIAARSATAEWTGDLQSGKGEITTPSTVLAKAAVTFPTRLGEPEGHTSPEELIAAAHASCFAMSMSGALGTAEIGYEAITVTATLSLGRVDGITAFTAADVQVSVTASTAGPQATREAIEEADSRCPVSNALRATMPVTVTVA